MRLELRKSGGEVCESCQSTEMIKVLGTVDAARDITRIVEAEWETREEEIRAAYEGRLKEKHQHLARAVPAVVARPKPRSIRFLKKRWQERLEEEISAAVHELLRETRF